MNTTVNASTFSNSDTQTALYMIGLRNAKITTENARLAALTPPGTPLPLLAVGTNPEIKASYEILLVEAVLSLHASWRVDEAAANGPNKQSFKDAFTNATPAGRDRALTQLLIP